MDLGLFLTQWSVRMACVFYVLAAVTWLTKRHEPPRWTWTLAFLFYLTHVVAAFSFYHGWSHQAAYEDTARQTEELLGLRWGGGLYFNYAFTGIWAGDVLWNWLTGGHERRPRWIVSTVQTFLAFMFFNATVVFATGWVRWIGVILAMSLMFLWIHNNYTKKAAIAGCDSDQR